MLNFKLFSAFLIIFLYGNAAYSQGLNENGKLANQIYQDSQIKEYFRFIDSRINQGTNDLKKKLTESEIQLLNKKFNQTLDYTHLENSVTQRLDETINLDSAKTALQWLSKPSIQSLHKLVSANLEVGKEVENYGKKLNTKDEETQQRIQIVNQIRDLTYSTEILINAALTVSRVVGFTQNQLKNKNERLSLSEMDQNINPHREQIIKLTKPSVSVQLLYSFRDKSLGDLKSYLAFLEKPIGEWYSKIIYTAYKETLENSTKNYIKTLQKLGE